MSDDQRLRTATKIILFGWASAILGAISVLLLRFNIIEYGGQLPVWIIPFFVIGSLLMLVGLLLGSRGVGVPLDTARLFFLILGYPCWIAAAIYVTIMFVLPMAYLAITN
jgi:hypothetical protein